MRLKASEASEVVPLPWGTAASPQPYASAPTGKEEIAENVVATSRLPPNLSLAA